MGLQGFKMPTERIFCAYRDAINVTSKTNHILAIIMYISDATLDMHKNEAIDNLKKLYNVIFDQEKINKGRFLYDTYEKAIKNKVLYSKDDAKIYCGFSWYRGFMTCNNIAFYVGE